MLEIKDISFSYQKDKHILKNVNACFEQGKVIAVQGESGQGKSTLLTILSGLEKDYEGSIVLDGNIVDKKSLHNFNRESISIIFQDLNLLNYLNIEENLRQGCLVKQKECSDIMQKACLEFFSIQNLNLKDYPAKISGGQQQRVAIIRALLSDTKIILADEPTANIDAKNAKTIVQVIAQVAKQENKIVILVTHDDNIAKLCDETYFLRDKTLQKKHF